MKLGNPNAAVNLRGEPPITIQPNSDAPRVEIEPLVRGRLIEKQAYERYCKRQEAYEKNPLNKPFSLCPIFPLIDFAILVFIIALALLGTIFGVAHEYRTHKMIHPVGFDVPYKSHNMDKNTNRRY